MQGLYHWGVAAQVGRIGVRRGGLLQPVLHVGELCGGGHVRLELVGVLGVRLHRGGGGVGMVGVLIEPGAELADSLGGQRTGVGNPHRRNVVLSFIGEGRS